jgi:uncharacterized protein (TIGR03437 family)
VISDSIAAIYGFEISARLESGPDKQQAGNFTPGTGQRVICSDNNPAPAGGCGGNGIQWLEHNTPSFGNTFSVQWTPPAGASGNIHLYVSGNAANGDNTPRNDHIYAADYVLTPASNATANVPVVSGIVNSASGTAGAEAGSWITINGTNFGTSNTTWDNSIIGGVFPTTLGGVTVAIDGLPAPISFVSATQINALVPATSTLGDVSVVVSNGNGSGKATTLTLAAAAPALFTLSQNAKYPAAVVLDSGTAFEFLAPSGLLGSSQQSRAAKAGDTILLFGTAFGRTTTPLNPELVSSVAFPLSHFGSDIRAPLATVTIGGVPATLLFCGITSPGLYQIDAVVPAGVPTGDQPLQISFVNGASITQNVVIPIQ